MGLSDVNYDIITALQSKLEALEVYDVYIQDCQDANDDEARRIFEEIRAEDERHADRLRDHVERVVREGRFR